jgi:hypothetical protein
MDFERLTRSISQFVLLPFYPVLQAFRFPPGGGNTLLHLLWCYYIRHLARFSFERWL